jgi:hypothetical protein
MIGLVTFVETKLFTKLVQQYLTDDEYGTLQQSLIVNPEAGDVIPGSGVFANCGGVWPAAANAVVFA